MTRENILNKIEKEWSAFLKSFNGLQGDILFEPGVCGQWSVRDILAHVTSWEEETLKALPLIVSKTTVPRYVKYGGIDGFNAWDQVRKKHYSIDRVMKDLHEVHQRLIEYIVSVPDAVFDSNKRFLKRAYYDTYGHYKEHCRQIIAWREIRGL